MVGRCYLTPTRYGVYRALTGTDPVGGWVGQLKVIVQPSKAAEILSAACLVSRSAGKGNYAAYYSKSVEVARGRKGGSPHVVVTPLFHTSMWA
jgi:hypothetical protein